MGRCGRLLGLLRFHNASIADTLPNRSAAAATLCGMSAERAARVTLSGDRSGDYVVVEEHDDGSLVVAPDTSMEAIRRRHNAVPAKLEEFEAEYGPIQLPDGEG